MKKLQIWMICAAFLISALGLAGCSNKNETTENQATDQGATVTENAEDRTNAADDSNVNSVTDNRNQNDGTAGDVVDDVGDAGKDLVDGVGDVGKDIIDGVENAGDEVIDGAQDLGDGMTDNQTTTEKRVEETNADGTVVNP